jgi:hypothetical protein
MEERIAYFFHEYWMDRGTAGFIINCNDVDGRRVWKQASQAVGFKPSNYKFQPRVQVRREKLPSWETAVREPEEEEDGYVPVTRKGWPWWKVPVVDATTPPAIRPRKPNRVLPALGLLFLWIMLCGLLAILLLTEEEDDTVDREPKDSYERLKAR